MTGSSNQPPRACRVAQVLALNGEPASAAAIAPWDGTDGVEPVEEEFDLSEIMGEL